MNINKYIDHTNLKSFASKKDIEKLCDEAIKYDFASVCVNPHYVGLAHELLIRSNVKVCTVIGFPLGQNTTEVKLHEAKVAIDEGADEIDMVINVAALKDKNYSYVQEEIKLIRELAKDKILKVIIETCYLENDEIIKITEICNEVGVDFIKTSTGFGTAGVTMEDIKLFKANIGPNVKMKAAGGVKTVSDMEAFINEGCDRIGTSSAINLIKGQANSGY